MYLHSVYIHWNIWLNELFHMINLHWGSLLPTQALNLLKVAKAPAKWCHSEEQRVRGNKLHAALVTESVPMISIKQGEMTVTSSRSALRGTGAVSGFVWVFFFLLISECRESREYLVGTFLFPDRSQSASFRLSGFGAFWTSSKTLLALWPDYPELC